MPVDPGYGERLANRVSGYYATTELSLLRRIARALTSGAESPQWTVEKLAQLEYLRRAMTRDVAQMDQAVAGEIQQVIGTAYTNGQSGAVEDLDRLGKPPAPLPPARALAVERLASETLSVVAPVGRRLLRASLDVYTDTVAEASASVLLGGNTRRDAAQHALDRLTAKGVTGFTDKAGRNWGAESYVEMAVRTGTGQAATQGHTDQLQANGLDLVMVSDSPRECDLCRPWEGKILALSGSSGTLLVESATTGEYVSVDVAGTLAEARRAGFQHPCCRHGVSAYLPGASRPATNTEDTQRRVKQEQRQREIERTIRKYKTRQATALTPEAEAKAKRKVKEWQGIMRDHLAATEGLDRKSSREQIGKAR